MNHEQALEAAARIEWGFSAESDWYEKNKDEYDFRAKRVVSAYLRARAESYDGYDLPKVTLPRLLADFDV